MGVFRLKAGADPNLIDETGAKPGDVFHDGVSMSQRFEIKKLIRQRYNLMGKSHSLFLFCPPAVSRAMCDERGPGWIHIFCSEHWRCKPYSALVLSSPLVVVVSLCWVFCALCFVLC